ncbi:MAG: reverse transcriptase family protein, partial [Oscillospiraceae bacterium]
STVITDHKAIYATSGTVSTSEENKKASTQCSYRKCIPALNAKYLSAIKNNSVDFKIDLEHQSTQVIFDTFYAQMNQILDEFYPVKLVTITNRDPPYMTPQIKHMLRLKNKFMRRGKMEAADALAKRILAKIIENNTSTFSNVKNTKDLWAKVRSVTGKEIGMQNSKSKFNASQLNAHYSSISTDAHYVAPAVLVTAPAIPNHIDERQVFGILDKLKPTSPGPDGIPSWFIRISAPLLAKTLSDLYNLSLARSEVPTQWKTSIITPIAKISQPNGCSDFRPISVTSILSRVLEKLVVRIFLYPALTNPDYTHLFADQFAFRPTGSTTAALINLTQTMAEMLQNYPYVHLISLDFSKAFDTVRHSTLLTKLSALPVEDEVHNWLINYLSGRTHSTKFNGDISCTLPINASIVQGSGIGPISYVINASDLHPKNQGNRMPKYADDGFLLVPSINSHTIQEELDHVTIWAKNNNLSLNISKTKELIVCRPRSKLGNIPPPHAGMQRVDSMKILGVTYQSGLSFREHVQHIVNRCSQNVYAIRTLRAHGLREAALWEVTSATLVSRATYASQVWWCMLDAASKQQLQAMLTKIIKQGFLPLGHPSFSDLCEAADLRLFSSITCNHLHVLHHMLPPKKITIYNLRARQHDREIPNVKDSLLRKTYLFKMLYLNCY